MFSKRVLSFELGKGELIFEAQFPMPNSRCPMPNALCPIPYAQCPMPIYLANSPIYLATRSGDSNSKLLPPELINWISALAARAA
jgi:hypothetical protein